MSGQYSEQDFDQADQLIRDRQIYKRRVVHSSEILSRLLARTGYAQQHAKEELNRVWNTITGDSRSRSNLDHTKRSWSEVTRVGNLRRGVLEIVVSNSAVCQQLNFERQALLSELQSALPQNKIRDLKFRVGNI